MYNTHSQIFAEEISIFCSKCHVHVWNQQTFNASQDCQVHYLIPSTCIYFNVTFILITEAEKKNDEANNKQTNVLMLVLL